jgi:hypothetical protein
MLGRDDHLKMRESKLEMKRDLSSIINKINTREDSRQDGE